MYNIQIFEQFIKSNLSSVEVYDKIIEINPIETIKKYCNDENDVLAIYIGGIGEEDLLTVERSYYTTKMKFDLKQIYVDFISFIRENLTNANKFDSFAEFLTSSVYKFSTTWFSNKNTPQAKKNNELGEIFLNEYKTAYGQHNFYINRVSTVNQEKDERIYNISSFEGTGNLAKCVEINSVACNLLNLCGFETALVQGKYSDCNVKGAYHTFPLYKDSNGDYYIFDCMLRKRTKVGAASDIDFSDGFNLERTVTRPFNSYTITYEIEPQKLIENSNKKK